MDEILRRLTAIEALLYTITGLMLVMVTVFFALWSIVIQGRRPNIPQLFDLTTKAVKRGVYALDVKLRKRKIKNMGQSPVVADVDEALVRIMARYILAELETKSLDDVDLSETKWIRRGEWKNLTGKTPEQWRAVMDRLEAKEIVERKGAKRTRVLSTAKRPSVAAKLKTLTPPPPAGG